MNQLIKKCVFIALLWTSSIFLIWCWKQEVQEQNIQKSSEFDKLVNNFNTELRESIQLAANEKIDKEWYKKWMKSDLKWTITMTLWNSTWNISFDTLWSLNTIVNQLYWKVDTKIEWSWLQQLWYFWDTLKARFSAEWILWKDTNYIKINWLDLWTFSEYFLVWKVETKKLDFIRWKWISFNKEKLCAEWWSKDWCETATTLDTIRDNFFKNIQEWKFSKYMTQSKILKNLETTIQKNITTNLFIQWKATTYQWYKAYSFQLNEFQLKKILEHLIESVYAEIDDVKQEELTNIRTMIDKLKIKNTTWYFVKKDWWTKIVLEDIILTWPEQKESDNWEVHISYNWIDWKLWFKFTVDNEEKLDLSITTEKTDEWYKFIWLVSPTLDWKKYWNWITIVSNSMTKDSKHIEEEKSYSIITVNKSLMKELLPQINNDLVVTLALEWKTTYWTSLSVNTNNAISFKDVEQQFDKLEKLSETQDNQYLDDFSQKKIDWNLTIKDPSIKK